MRAKLTLLSGLKTSLVGAQKAGVRTFGRPGAPVCTMCGQDRLMVTVLSWPGAETDWAEHDGAQVLLSNPTCAGQHQHHHSRYLVCDWI